MVSPVCRRSGYTPPCGEVNSLLHHQTGILPAKYAMMEALIPRATATSHPFIAKPVQFRPKTGLMTVHFVNVTFVFIHIAGSTFIFLRPSWDSEHGRMVSHIRETGERSHHYDGCQLVVAPGFSPACAAPKGGATVNAFSLRNTST